MIKKVQWFSAPITINENFEEVEDRLLALEEVIDNIEDSLVITATTVFPISGDAIPVVPAIADVAAAKAYLDDLVPILATNLGNIEAKINEIIQKLKDSNAIAAS